MKRRNFIVRSSLLGGAALIPSLAKGFEKEIDAVLSDPDDRETVKKVITAMLSMQRATWEQGVAAQAFLELGDEKMTFLLAKEAALRQLPDGRLSVVYTDNGVTDPSAAGEAVYTAAKKTGDEELIKAWKAMLDYLLHKAPKTDKGILNHTLNSPQVWIDSMYMAPPFIAAAGHPEEAMKQIRGFRELLWNAPNKLYSHQWDDANKKFISDRFWGVGNGWAAAGLSRVIQSLPAKMKKEKKELIQYVTEHLEGCLKYIRKDYLFHNYINEPDTFTETNLSQMLAYTIFRGVHNKWLDGSYLAQAEKMRNAARAKIDENGYVQGVAGAPTFQIPGRAVEGQAFFLLMEAAYADLKQ